MRDTLLEKCSVYENSYVTKVISKDITLTKQAYQNNSTKIYTINNHGIFQILAKEHPEKCIKNMELKIELS